MLPVLSGFGWALVGSIIGCSGLLVSKKLPARIERGFEKDVDDAKLVITFPVLKKEDLSVVRALLKEVGAFNFYCSGDAA